MKRWLLASAGLLANALLGSNVYAQFAEIDFSDRPNYVSNNTLSLSFDDGPDWNNTAKILDILRDKGVKATFFINSENWSNIWVDGPMKDLVRRIVSEGHELANHTQKHDHLPYLSNQEVESQIRNVQDAVNSIFGGVGPKLTLLRAPHGEPFQFKAPTDYQRIAPIVAKYAVHIGWGVDTFDYECTPGDGQCVYNNFVQKVATPGKGAYGSVLMHSVHAQTVNALPSIIDYARRSGFRLVTTEDLVRARYGKTSAEIVSGSTTPTTPPTSNVVYSLVNRHSNKCLDVSASNPNNGAKIQQWDCNNTNAQAFRLRDMGTGRYMLVNVNSNRCLDIEAWGVNNGSRVIQWDCHGGNNQLWTLGNSVNGTKVLRSVHSPNRCLDIDGPSLDNGKVAQIWDCAGSANQDWTLRRR